MHNAGINLKMYVYVYINIYIQEHTDIYWKRRSSLCRDGAATQCTHTVYRYMPSFYVCNAYIYIYIYIYI